MSGGSWSVRRARLGAQWHLRRATCGARCLVWGTPRIDIRGTAIIGDGVSLHSDAARIEISVAEFANLTMGHDVLIGQGTSIGVTRRVEIGDRCRIGPHVQIMDNDFHCLDPAHRDERPESRPVEIGDDVCIGAMSLVLPGAVIRAGSVIAARSVVTGTIPARSLVFGIPARAVRTL
jgi:acetyltransferase-like isoleucine patch superfamily enzyme